MMMSDPDVVKPGGYRKKWPVDQFAMTKVLRNNDTMRAGTRAMPFCTMAGSDCRSETIEELDGDGLAPYIYHCMRYTGDSKWNVGRVLSSARKRFDDSGQDSGR